MSGNVAFAQRYEPRTTESDSESEDGESVSKDKQNDTADRWRNIGSRLVPGGNFSLSFGNYTYVDISPMLGYRVSDRVMAGVGGTYIYYNSLLTIVDPATGQILGQERVKGSIYGGRVFSNFSIIPSIFVHGEYEALNVDYIIPYTNELDRRWIGNIFVGGGYRAYVGPRSHFMITVLYNLNYKNNMFYSPYVSPFVFRMGFLI